MVVLSLSDPVQICSVGCPFKDTMLHFLGSGGAPDSSIFQIKSGRSFRPKFSIVSSRISIKPVIDSFWLHFGMVLIVL